MKNFLSFLSFKNKEDNIFHGVNIVLKENKSIKGFAIYPKNGYVKVYWKNIHKGTNHNSEDIMIENIENLEIVKRIKRE